MTQLKQLPPSWADELLIATASSYGVGKEPILQLLNQLLASGKAKIEEQEITVGDYRMPSGRRRLIIDLTDSKWSCEELSPTIFTPNKTADATRL